jgi:uncharacterized membrane protein YbhN (UPF0104 family)
MITARPPETSRRRATVQLKLLVIVLIGIGLYLFIPHLSGLGDAWEDIRGAQKSWLAFASLCLVSTYFIAAGSYMLLAKQRLSYGHSIVLQIAGTFASRVLPAGLGGLGLNYLYLRHNKHSPAQAGAVVATNNALGVVASIALTAAALAVTRSPLPKWHVPHIGLWIVLGVAIVIAAAVFFRQTKLWQRLLAGLEEMVVDILAYRHQPGRIVGALGCALALTIVDTAILYAAAHAIGGSLSFGVAIIVMTVGVAVATVTPTPGGLGTAEAALAAALVLYGVHAADAVAIALLFRFFTYWVGFVFGSIALLVAKRRHFI